MQVLGYLRVAVAVASTGCASWCVLATREETTRNGKGCCNLHIFQTSAQTAASLYHKLLEKNVDFFLTRDGPLLIQALVGAGLQPAACRTKLAGSSCSNVYKISPPQDFRVGGSNGPKCLGVHAQAHEILAVKVVHNATEFYAEQSSLQKLASHDGQFSYAFGAVCSDSERPQEPKTSELKFNSYIIGSGVFVAPTMC
jgi:hypothetical protein